MTKEEKESRDKGREAVRASKEIPQLASRLKEIVRSGNLDDGAPTMTPSDYRSTLNKLRSALYQTGKTPSEIDAYISKIIEGATVAKATHSFDSRDEFYAAVFDYKKENKIEHHGILGMKWGIRRYQNPDGSLTALGQKRMASGKTQRVIDKFNAKKANAIATGDAKFAKKYLDYMTNDDIKKLNERITSRTSILNLEKEAMKVSADKLQAWSSTAANIFNNAANLTENGVRLYNTVVKINNSFSKHKMSPIKSGGDEENQWFKRTIVYEDEQGRKITEVRNVKEK